MDAGTINPNRPSYSMSSESFLDFSQNHELSHKIDKENKASNIDEGYISLQGAQVFTKISDISSMSTANKVVYDKECDKMSTVDIISYHANQDALQYGTVIE